jgi:hypothetical protein
LAPATDRSTRTGVPTHQDGEDLVDEPVWTLIRGRTTMRQVLSSRSGNDFN